MAPTSDCYLGPDSGSLLRQHPVVTEARPANIFLVDDHPIIRNGFRRLLESEKGFIVVGEADSGEEALSRLEETEVDLAVVDISMEGMDGFDLTRQLTGVESSHWDSDLQDTLVLIVSMHKETHYVETALEAGAKGYVLKDTVHIFLPEAVRKVLNGNVFLDPNLRGNL